ncbi:60S ribosomal protein L35a-3 [Turnera subulata]|uniref:60S ribosomal protein L35a-3 n=1 Tax=Turnera subulata TaxID=218843 RepID=A0A9Q0JBI1_9ROSI|nr:60S ribosomal protein L35a-3 [Turnera subulata]
MERGRPRRGDSSRCGGVCCDEREGMAVPATLSSAARVSVHRAAERHKEEPTMVKGRQGERVRLYVRGTILGYKRSKSNQYPNTSLLQIEGVNTKEEVNWYAGKRLAYIYKAAVKRNGTHYRCIWGKVTRPHGNSGVVRAKFKSNLPPKSMGARVRVFMYPSNI